MTSRILSAVAAEFGCTQGQLLRRNRTPRLSRPRMVAMWLMHHEMSLPMIGRALGHRHHTTVLHGCQTVEQDCELRLIAVALGMELGLLTLGPQQEGNS